MFHHIAFTIWQTVSFPRVELKWPSCFCSFLTYLMRVIKPARSSKTKPHMCDSDSNIQSQNRSIHVYLLFSYNPFSYVLVSTLEWFALECWLLNLLHSVFCLSSTSKCVQVLWSRDMWTKLKRASSFIRYLEPLWPDAYRFRVNPTGKKLSFYVFILNGNEHHITKLTCSTFYFPITTVTYVILAPQLIDSGKINIYRHEPPSDWSTHRTVTWSNMRHFKEYTMWCDFFTNGYYDFI